MSNDQGNTTTDIQRALAADGRDHRRLMLEEWRLSVQTSIDEVFSFQKLAAEYAQIALKSAFIANAGALVALPPLMQWLPAHQRLLIPLSAWWFVVGFVLAALCAVVAYANFMIIASVNSARASVSAIQLAVSYGLRDQTAYEDKGYKKNVAAESRLRLWILATMIFALLAGFGSYVAFLTGVFEFRQIVM